jgi:hypothetical protein
LGQQGQGRGARIPGCADRRRLAVAGDPDEVHDITDARGRDELAAADPYAADCNLDATYLIRMFSVFERAVVSFGRSLPGYGGRELAADILLEEVGVACRILTDVIRNAQKVRIHRNNLVQGRTEDHAGAMHIESCRADLQT